MDQTTIDLIRGVVETLYNDDAIFSAFDITRELRETHQLVVKHYEVKQQVHSMFENGQFPTDYKRNLHNIPNNPRGTWLYHPSGADISTYDPNGIRGRGGVFPFKSGGTATVVAAPTTTRLSNMPAHVDSSGRVLIRKKAVEAIGLSAGDSVYVTYGTNQVKVYADYFQLSQEFPNNAFVELLVAKDGELRICKKWVTSSNLPTLNQYKVTQVGQSGNVLVIE